MFCWRNAATKRWLAGLSRSNDQCAVLNRPSIGSPTAGIMSSSAEKAVEMSATSFDSPAPTNCLMKLTPIAPGKKKYSASGFDARICASSAE
ncbi:hypothetical protein D3C72_1729900 [compost metagenome]